MAAQFAQSELPGLNSDCSFHVRIPTGVIVRSCEFRCGLFRPYIRPVAKLLALELHFLYDFRPGERGAIFLNIYLSGFPFILRAMYLRAPRFPKQ